MSDIKQAFGSSTSFTITLASLASSATAGRESAVIDNSSLLYLDIIVNLTIKLGSTTPANDKTVYIYAAGSEDGTNFTDNAAGGGDAAITIRTPSNLKLIGTIQMPTASTSYVSGPMSVAQAFGVMPRKISIIVVNFTGSALDSTEGNHIKTWSGVYSTVV
jgi:hypothetical protein